MILHLQDLVETAESALITNSSEFKSGLSSILSILFVVVASAIGVFLALAAAVVCARKMRRRPPPPVAPPTGQVQGESLNVFKCNLGRSAVV